MAVYLNCCKFRPSILTQYHFCSRPPVLLTRDSRGIRGRLQEVIPGTACNLRDRKPYKGGGVNCSHRNATGDTIRGGDAPMHVVIYMNLQWKIILSTCLVIAICFATASAAIESPFTKSSFDKSSATAFADAKASAMENMKTGFEKPAFNPPDPIEEPEFPDVPEKPTVPEIPRPAFNPIAAPTSRVPDLTFPRTDGSNRINSLQETDTYISRNEAVEIALARFPGIVLISPVKATFKKLIATGRQFPDHPCWVVEIEGVRPDCTANWMDPLYGMEGPVVPCILYGGMVTIDAVTGDILYIDRPAYIIFSY